MPHLEFIRNATSQKYGGLTAVDFVLGQFRIANPLAAPLWLAGLWYFLFAGSGRKFRALGDHLPGRFSHLDRQRPQQG